MSATVSVMRDARPRRSRGASLIPVVKASNFRECHYATFRRRMDASWCGRVFLEGEMRACPMIIKDVLSKHTTQMLVAQNDHVIQTLAAQGADQSLRIRIL